MSDFFSDDADTYLHDEESPRGRPRGHRPEGWDVQPYESDLRPGQDESWRRPGPFTGIGPRNYRRSDERIREEVCERLTQYGQLDASGIEVNVEDGEVSLQGRVDSRWAKRTAEDIVEGVNGVRDVHNRLRILSETDEPGLDAHPWLEE